MNDEKFIREEADELTLLLADRLGERSRKLERMAEMDKPRHRTVYMRSAVMFAAAACAAVLFILVPTIKNDPLAGMTFDPGMEQYRAGSSEMTEVTTLIDEEKYDDALPMVEVLIEKYEAEVAALPEDCDDEQEYEKEELKVMISDLVWADICILLKQNKYDEAEQQLKKYVNDQDHANNLEDAKKILEKIK